MRQPPTNRNRSRRCVGEVLRTFGIVGRRRQRDHDCHIFHDLGAWLGVALPRPTTLYDAHQWQRESDKSALIRASMSAYSWSASVTSASRSRLPDSTRSRLVAVP